MRHEVSPPDGPHDNPARPVHFIVPGALETLTGGFIYDRRMIEGLAAAGRLGGVHELRGDFPRAAPYDVAAGAAVLAGLPDRSCCVIDGLALSALGAAVAQHTGRLDLVAMVHHPLADETGLDMREREAFFMAEKAVLAHVRGIIVSSARTAGRLGDYGITPSAVHVVEPGISDLARTGGAGKRKAGMAGETAGEGPLNILSVGTLIPRKGHDTALRALALCRDPDWRLDIVGAARDAGHAAALSTLVAEAGLQDRVRFLDGVDEAELAALHRGADLFLLATRHEGFGMALADAVAFGLPVVTTGAGAVSGAVQAAAELVPADNAEALATILREVLADAGKRAALAERSRAAAPDLADWPRAQAAFRCAIDRISQAAFRCAIEEISQATSRRAIDGVSSGGRVLQ